MAGWSSGLRLRLQNHPRFIPEGVAEATQMFLRHAHVLPKIIELSAIIEKIERDGEILERPMSSSGL
jgi:hypothetical protein